MNRPNDDQINDQIDLAGHSIEKGTTAVPGMTYEDGVDAALRWAMGDSDDAPMDGIPELDE